MSSQTTLKKIEHQIVRLPINDLLKLIARISELLSMAQIERIMAVEEQRSLIQQREKEADSLLAIYDAAAEQWVGDFGSSQDIRQVRKKT